MKEKSRFLSILLCAVLCVCMVVTSACSGGSDKQEEAANEDAALSEAVQEEVEDSDEAEEAAETEVSDEDQDAEDEDLKAQEAAEAEKAKKEKEAAEKAAAEKKKKEEQEKNKKKTSKSSDKNAGKKWVEPVYKEVYHEEEGHYETQNTGRIKCCGKRSGKDGCAVYFSSMDAYKSHQQAYVAKKRKELNDPNYECQGDHAPAKYETEEVWVVDKAAWTEQVLVEEGHWE